MDTIVDFGTELLVDRTRVSVPQLKLLLTAIGRPLVRGSAWISIDRCLADFYGLVARPGRDSSQPSAPPARSLLAA
jgi:hypothetical protein